jgi:V/A-type H+-transporting ATPase subunit A
LDTDLAYKRHFPAINWLTSYSLYAEEMEEWFGQRVAEEWGRLRERALDILQREDELKEIVRLVGPEALSPTQRLLLTIARSLREDFLMQNALHPVDTYSSLEKTYRIVRVVLTLYDRLKELLEAGVPYSKLEEHPIFDRIARLRYVKEEDMKEEIGETMKRVRELSVE